MMACSWSHTQQAYAAAQTNLSNLDKPTLDVIFAEWRSAQVKHGLIPASQVFNQRKYDRALKFALTLDHDTLIEFVWDNATELSTCENGGFDAWMCPYGCGCHCVSFSLPEDEDEDQDD